jgi:hypothetical protein
LCKQAPAMGWGQTWLLAQAMDRTSCSPIQRGTASSLCPDYHRVRLAYAQPSSDTWEPSARYRWRALLADLLGHKDPAFTLRRYVHRVSGAVEKARKAIGQRYRAEV